jgi:hypothetical protein
MECKLSKSNDLSDKINLMYENHIHKTVCPSGYKMKGDICVKMSALDILDRRRKSKKSAQQNRHQSKI